ncbi:MAG: Flagellin N-methylase [Spirochaetes bacterium ADurb.Bin269]|nr:MAG: Flagellin N-methylase [Spirochaetes bacterium ADurb.Bin269]
MRHLSKLNKVGFDSFVHECHRTVFAKIDCIACGLCCRNFGPLFRNTDIKHICAEIGTDPKRFTERYLRQDPDGVGFLLKELPCPFQRTDNTCEVYEERTLSCKSFPHTESVNIQKKLVGLALDSLYCPAAFLICEMIMDEY